MNWTDSRRWIMKFNCTLLAFVVFSAVSLAGCGGGGSHHADNNDDPVNPQPPVNPDPVIIDDGLEEGQNVSELLGDLNIDLPTAEEDFVDLVIPYSQEAGFSIVGVRYGEIEDNHDGTFRYSLPLNRLDTAWNDYRDVIKFRIGDEEYYVSFPLVRDPMFYEQWHLRNVEQSGFLLGKYIHDLSAGRDLNVIPVWRQGVTGKNIRVAVIDDGFDPAHEDLNANIDFDRSYYYQKDMADPTNLSKSHATAVSGIIASVAKNDTGVRGVAFDSKLMALAGIDDQSELAYLSGYVRYADLVNESFSRSIPVLNYTMTDYIDAIYERDIPVIKSQGNEFEKAYNTASSCQTLGINCFFKQGDYHFVAPGVIAVAAVTGDGSRTSYSTGGSNIWITAFGGTQNRVITTDPTSCEHQLAKDTDGNEFDYARGIYANINGECNYNASMSGTSSAAPMISGVVSLMKSAVSGLTVEQIKYALAKTAINDLKDSHMVDGQVKDSGHGNLVVHKGWTQTESNLRFSSVFGFGRVDAAAAVDLVKNCSSDADCRRRGEKPETIRASTFYCSDETGGSNSYNSYKCTLGDFVDEDGNPFTRTAQIEHAVLHVNTAPFKTTATNKSATIAMTQFELVKDDHASAVSIPKQMHETISADYSGMMLMANNIFYLAPFNNSTFTLYIRTPADLHSDLSAEDPLTPELELRVYPR